MLLCQSFSLSPPLPGAALLTKRAAQRNWWEKETERERKTADPKNTRRNRGKYCSTIDQGRFWGNEYHLLFNRFYKIISTKYMLMNINTSVNFSTGKHFYEGRSLRWLVKIVSGRILPS